MLSELLDFSCRNKPRHIKFIIDYRYLTSQLIAVIKKYELTSYLFKLLFLGLLYCSQFFVDLFKLDIKIFQLSVKLCRCCFTVTVQKVRKTDALKIKAFENIVYLYTFLYRCKIKSPDITVLFFKRLEHEAFFAVKFKLV